MEKRPVGRKQVDEYECLKRDSEQSCCPGGVLFANKWPERAYSAFFASSVRLFSSMRAYLHQHAQLTDAELEQTLAVIRPCTFRKGTELFCPGPPPDRLYFIESGLARAYRLVRGEDITSALYGAGSFCFDTLSIVAQVPTELYFECLTDVQAHEILIPDLNRLFRRVPPIERLGRRINENLVCGLTERLRAFQMDDLR